MVKERRKRVQARSMVRTRATVLSMQHNDIGVSIKKEPRLDNNKNLKNDSSNGMYMTPEARKSTVSINSIFYTQTAHVSMPDFCKTEPSVVPIEETFFKTEETSVPNDIVSDVSHFSTDETPVAVPIHGPSTPHRINMPTSQMEDLDEGNINTEDDKKLVMSAITLTPQPLKKPTNRGRRKLNGNQVTGHRPYEFSETKTMPIHGPSTPHRINMTNSQMEDLDEGNINTEDDKKLVISAVILTPQPLKKPTNRGRRKLNGNQVAGHRPNESSETKSINHKLTDYFPVRRSVRKSKKAVLEEKQRDMENKVLCQVEEGLEVRHFAGKGRGVVTTREFMKGEFVVEYIGELIDQLTAKEREKIYAQDQSTGCYMYYFQHRNHQYCVDATAETDKLGRLVNHSRNGNLVARVIEVGSTPHLVLTAKENIPSGIEVNYDYGDRSREAIRYHPWLAL